MSQIYLITNQANQKCYVGQTIRTLAVRWKRHCSAANQNSKTLIAQAIRKYGNDSFKIEQLEDVADVSLLNERERHWIATLHTNACAGGHGYNMTDGGEGRVGFKASIETRHKISLAQRGKKLSDETKRKLSERNNGKSNVGIKRSNETRHRMSLAQKGKKRSLDVRCNVSIGHDAQKKPVRQLTLSGEKLREFESVSAAKRWLRDEKWPKAACCSIVSAANGRTSTAYGFRWRWSR